MNTYNSASSFSSILRRFAVFVGSLIFLILTAMEFGPRLKPTSATSLAGAICTWNGTAGDWNDSSKWSCGAVPGAGDTAIIASGTVTVSADATVGTVQFSGGALTCNANLTLNDLMTWTAGTINGSATGKIVSNGAFTMSGASPKSFGCKLENHGTLNWLGGQLLLFSNIDNQAGATFNIQTAGPVSGAGGTLNNSGAITKSGGSTTFFDNVPFNNSGMVNIDAGVLRFGSTSVTNSSGPYNVAAGATLSFTTFNNVTQTISPTGSISGAGALEFLGAIATINGAVNVTGGVLLNNGATVSFNTTTDFTNLSLFSGDLSGSGAITILNDMNWIGGAVSGSGTFTIPSGVTLNLTGANQKILSGRKLINNGAVNWVGGQFILSSDFENHAGATFDIQSAGPMSGGGGNLINAGAMTKSGGTTTFFDRVSLSNTGTVDINSGILTLSGGAFGGSNTNTSGPFNIASGATLNLGIGTHTINPAGSISGAGALNFVGGTANVNGGFNVTGGVSINGATVNFNTTTNITMLSLAGAGVLSGSGALTILNAMDWTGGDIARSGALTISSGAPLNISGQVFKVLYSTLTNNGVMNYLGGHLSFSDIIFDNRPGATFNIQTDNPLEGGGTIQNAGTMIKTGGAPSIIRAQLNNSGRLEISSTSLSFVDTFDQPRTVNQTGGVTHLDNGTLSANLTINGGVLEGIGSVSGNVTNSGIISPGLSPVAPGTITINKSYTQTATGRLDIELGGTNPGINSDLLVANTVTSTNSALAGTLNVSLLNGFRPPVNATFQIMRYLSHNGAFASTNGLDLGGGQILNPDYRSSELVLVSGDGGPAAPWVQVIADPQETRELRASTTARSPRRVVMAAQRRATQTNETSAHFTFKYNLIVGNSGSHSTPAVVVVEVPPASPGVPVPHDLIEDSISNDPLVPIDNPADRELFSQIPKRVVAADGTVRIPFVMVLPPHTQFVLRGGFESTVATSEGNSLVAQSRFRLQAGAGCPGSPEPKAKAFGNSLHPPSGECIKSILESLLGFIPGGDCVQLARTIIQNLLLSGGTSVLTGTPVSAQSVITSILVEIAKCVSDAFPLAEAIKIAAEVFEFASKLNDIKGIFDNCAGSVLPNPLDPEFDSEDETKCVTSKDPNDKVGADGVGPERFITGSESFRYAVFFENVPDATAPAQVVSIADHLDPALLNFNTFALGPISFAGKHVTPPPNSSSFTTDVDMRPEKNLLVRVNADLNKSTGLLTWSFTSIDPASGQPLPPTSVEGFLDPNVTPPEGEGSVLFFVAPKTGLPTGTIIRNRARIVFDQNAPLDTPEWFNTIDNAKPTSQVLPLAASQCSSFRVEWSGSDATSGIAHYSIFVSKNGGPFEPWVLNTPQTSDFFNGVAGSTYAFYSVARDGAGNVEDPPAQPDTSATITTAMSINPTSQSSMAQGGNGIVDVMAPGDCNWIAVSKSFFVRVTTSPSGAGNGLVTYSVDANPTDEARDGAIMIAGQRFLIHQAAGPATANQAPDAVDDNATTNQGTPVTIAVLANDSDPDGDPLTIGNLSSVNHGTLAINADNTVTYSPTSGFSGTDTFTYTISDGRGGSDTATVTVTISLSNRSPNAVCQNISRFAGANCQATVSAQEVDGGSSDPDGDAITLALTPAGPFAVGSHSVTLTVTDSHGASSTCTSTLTVIDNTPPVVNCPSNIVIAAAAGQCVAAVTYSASATDNCGGTTVTCTPPSGSTFSVGVTVVSCVGRDASNNTANCSFSVTVNDTQPPTISCPPNLSVTAGTGATSAVVSYTQPLGNDNCSSATTVCVPASGSSFPIGVSTVICRVTDTSSNAAQCSFTVTVSAASAPADRIAFESNRDGNFEIYTMNADGSNSTRRTFNSQSDISPAWSPDRTKIAFISTRDGNPEIYVMNADGTNQTRLTSTSAIEDDPSWSPDGTKIAFWSMRDGNPEIYVMNANGTNQTRVTSNSRSDTQPQWSPDGTKLVFVSNRDNLVNFDIYVMNANGSNVTRLTTNQSVDESPDWSPDGTKIVFTSNRSNLLDFEIWVMNANGSNQTRLTSSTRSSVRPTWSRDGAKITFATNRDSLLNFEIYTMDANGSSQTRITTSSAIDFNPDR